MADTTYPALHPAGFGILLSYIDELRDGYALVALSMHSCAMVPMGKTAILWPSSKWMVTNFAIHSENTHELNARSRATS